MTRFTKALVFAGGAAMIVSPMAAGAAGNAAPVVEEGIGVSGGLSSLGIGGIVLGAVTLGLLVSGASKSD